MLVPTSQAIALLHPAQVARLITARRGERTATPWQPPSRWPSDVVSAGRTADPFGRSTTTSLRPDESKPPAQRSIRLDADVADAPRDTAEIGVGTPWVVHKGPVAIPVGDVVVAGVEIVHPAGIAALTREPVPSGTGETGIESLPEAVGDGSRIAASVAVMATAPARFTFFTFGIRSCRVGHIDTVCNYRLRTVQVPA